MTKLIRLSLVLFVLTGFPAALAAQEAEMTGPPKLLYIQREFVKPLHSTDHAKTETAYIRALTAAKWPGAALALESLSGKPRVLFVQPYSSFEEWEKMLHMAFQKDPALAAAIDRADIADREHLESVDQHVLRYMEEYSRPSKRGWAKVRYWIVARFLVRPGHEMEFLQIVKAYLAAAEKDVVEDYWAMYAEVYGGPGSSFILFGPCESAAELDHQPDMEKAYMASFGAEGGKKIAELTAASTESVESNLFAVNPKMSYPPAEWVKADPDFWAPKKAAPPAATAPAAAKEKEKKPAAKP